jgi:hypothetical protein
MKSLIALVFALLMASAAFPLPLSAHSTDPVRVQPQKHKVKKHKVPKHRRS